MTLGICDWGIGGIGLYQLVKQARPDIEVTYLADQGATPYSQMGRSELSERVGTVLQTLRLMGIHQVVFAGDEASTAIPEVSAPGMTVSGVIEPTLRAMRNRRHSEVGIIGGRRTVLSGAYGRALRKMRFCVLQRVSDDLPVALEHGHTTDGQIREILAGLLEPLYKADCIVMACSQFRIVEEIVRELAPRAVIEDPIRDTLSDVLRRLPESTEGVAEDRFLTTGDPGEMQRRVKDVFGLDLMVGSVSPCPEGLGAFTA